MICVTAERQRRKGKLPPRQRRVCRGFSLGLLLGLFLVIGLPIGGAWAGKVEDLSRLLLEEDSYKVRVQAAALLGKLGDPAAVAPLSRALSDSNKTVRWMAAQALARLGDPRAVPALKALLVRENDGPVRTQVEKALAILSQTPRKTAKIFLTFGTFRGGVRGADPAALEILRGALRRELGKLSTVTFEEVRTGNTGSGGPVGFLIDGTVSRLDDGVSGSGEINCDVKVMVARWPSKSIILWTSAGAAVQGGGRPQDVANSRRDCLEASAGQLGEDLMKFFQSQGG
jgi:hypothetical protein